jgi:hypothetical protein
MIGLPGGPRGMSDLRGKEMVNVPLLQALLCAALYPQIMTVEYPKPKPGKKIKVRDSPPRPHHMSLPSRPLCVGWIMRRLWHFMFRQISNDHLLCFPALQAESLKFRIREEGHEVPTEVVLHPSSINSKCTRFHSSYLVYHERVCSSSTSSPLK